MTCYAAVYDGAPTPSAEVEEIDWLDYSQKDRTSPVDRLIFDDLKAKDLIF